VGFLISERVVLQRITRLQKRWFIRGYTTILSPAILATKTNRTPLFQISDKANEGQIEELKAYFSGSPFCTFAEWLRGMGYLCHWVFDTEKQFDLQFNVFLRKFSDVISDYMISESKMIKEAVYGISFDRSHEKLRINELLINLRLKATI
jgi:DNA-binding Lrp family transcriptional regulator